MDWYQVLPNNVLIACSPFSQAGKEELKFTSPWEINAGKDSYLSSTDGRIGAQVPRDDTYTEFASFGTEKRNICPCQIFIEWAGVLILSRKTNRAVSASGCPRLSTSTAGKISGWCTILIQLLTHVHQDAAFN